MRSAMVLRSHCPNDTIMFMTSSPIGDEVSTNGSETEVKPTSSSFIRSSKSAKSRTLLDSRSMRNTSTLSIIPFSQSATSRW